MKKKGFTLIELLAVIVILAIIALIATPLVLKYIETSKNNAKITSTYNFIRGVENALVTYSMDKKGQSYPDGCYEISVLNTDLNISVKGDVPTEGQICIDNSKVTNASVKYNDNKIVNYEDEKATVSTDDVIKNFNNDVIFEDDVKLVYSNSDSYATVSCLGDKVEFPASYDIIIDGETYNTLSMYNNDENAFVLINQVDRAKYVETQGGCIIGFVDIDLSGEHHIKIVKTNKEIVPYNIRVSDGRIYLFSSEINYAETNIKITDNNNIVYYDGAMTLDSSGTYNTFWVDSSDFVDSQTYSNFTNIVKNAGSLNFETTQIIDGNEVKNTISVPKFNYVAQGVGFDGCEPNQYYYYGNNSLSEDIYGC